MTPTEALKEMLDRSGMSMYALSKTMGKSRNYVQNTLARETLRSWLLTWDLS